MRREEKEVVVCTLVVLSLSHLFRSGRCNGRAVLRRLRQQIERPLERQDEAPQFAADLWESEAMGQRYVMLAVIIRLRDPDMMSRRPAGTRDSY